MLYWSLQGIIKALQWFSTVNRKIKISKINSREYIVNGTSADCVNIATRGLLSTQPDYVMSGINFGSNMGDDVVYSGTIGAAIEGRFCKKISVAISITNRKPKYLDDIEKTQSLFTQIASNKILIRYIKCKYTRYTFLEN